MGLKYPTFEESEYPPTPSNDSLAHIMNGGDTCPNCQSDDVSWGDPEPEGDEVFRTCHCLRCGNSFTEIYPLGGLCEDHQDRTVLKFTSESPVFRGGGFVTFGKDGLNLYLHGMAKPIDILAMMRELERQKPIIEAATRLNYSNEEGMMVSREMIETMAAAVKQYKENAK
jgi:hypothetical protein